ncbi:hypothetical protein CR513_32662, partial [Mucuna pruriens]
MSRMGIKFEDEFFGLLLLNFLLESWETFKVSITNSAPNGVVSLQMVKGSILNEEMRRKAQGSSYQSKVLVTKNRRISQKKEREKSRSKSKSRYKNRTKAKRVSQKRSMMMMMIMSLLLQSVNFVFDESMWIIDSSAILHITPMKKFFTSYTSGDFGVLKMGNEGVTKVIGVGDVSLQTNTRMKLWLRGVKHAPNVRFNLISVHMLDDGGYDNHFGHGKWKLTKDKMVVARGEKISKLLSYINEKGLNCLVKKDMLPRLKNA